MTKTPTPTEQSKKQRDNIKTPPKTLITQLLRTDLGRSVGVTAVTQLVWLNRSKQMNLLYRIIHSKKEAWNVIGKHWLQGLDRKYQENFFLCKCTSTEGLDIPEMSTFYVKTLNTWTKFIFSC